uniref:WGS project CBMI000000000 data, contig CS3069_c000429 n=1 Tax=Fusarium clavum TaxID=2594811 RepID=A0A090MAK3_9HYPO|nr:unnamed protein product [Fusarium clavum]
MERSSKLADLKLVSKYYPVTNYSYPQQPERPSQYVRSRFSNDRASLGSEGSSPSLIDDRTDSEVSLDDDYQYHAHGAELWDSFWLPNSSRPITPKDSRPTTAQEMRLRTPPERDSYFETASRGPTKHLCSTSSQPPASVILSKKSLPCMRPLPPTPPPEAEEAPEAEPHSVFEYDDDSDTESGGRSFWFHRRSGSDQRKTGHRTAPSSPRKRQNDVIGRMLGRRSRG